MPTNERPSKLHFAKALELSFLCLDRQHRWTAQQSRGRLSLNQELLVCGDHVHRVRDLDKQGGLKRSVQRNAKIPMGSRSPFYRSLWSVALRTKFSSEVFLHLSITYEYRGSKGRKGCESFPTRPDALVTKRRYTCIWPPRGLHVWNRPSWRCCLGRQLQRLSSMNRHKIASAT